MQVVPVVDDIIHKTNSLFDKSSIFLDARPGRFDDEVKAVLFENKAAVHSFWTDVRKELIGTVALHVSEGHSNVKYYSNTHKDENYELLSVIVRGIYPDFERKCKLTMCRIQQTCTCINVLIGEVCDMFIKIVLTSCGMDNASYQSLKSAPSNLKFHRCIHGCGL